MRELVTLSKKEQKRLTVLNQVEIGNIVGKGGAEALDISLRHVRRLLAAYRKEGAAALAHGNTKSCYNSVAMTNKARKRPRSSMTFLIYSEYP